MARRKITGLDHPAVEAVNQALATAAASHPPRRVEVAVPGQPVVRARCAPSGRVVLVHWTTVAGKRRPVEVGRWLGSVTTQDEADRLLAVIDTAARATTMPLRGATLPNPHAGAAVDPNVTLKDFLDIYASAENGLQQWENPVEAKRVLELHAVGYVDAHAPGMRVRDFTTADVQAIVDHVRHGLGHANTARKVATGLRGLFDYAVLRRVIPTSPAASFRAGIEIPPRSLTATDEEMGAMWRWVFDSKSPYTENMRMAVALMAGMGRREGELVLARWEHIDLEQATWRIPPENRKMKRNKRATARAEIVKLPPQMIAALKRLRDVAPSSPWVLASPTGSKSGHMSGNAIANAFQEMQGKGYFTFAAGRLTPHDLRKPIRTAVEEKGWANAAVAEAILGHVTTGIEAVYSFAQFVELQFEARCRWCNFLDAMAGIKAPDVVNLDAARAKA